MLQPIVIINLVVLVLLVVFIMTRPASGGRKTIAYKTNEFGPVWVFDDAAKRCLVFSDPAKTVKLQSCMLIAQPGILELSYQKLMLASLLLNPNPQRILMLGLGGASMVGALQKLLPSSAITVVEINPLIQQFAKQYFHFVPGPLTTVIIADAFSYVLHSEEQFDLIIFDVFTADATPRQFASAEFMHKLKTMLAPSGVLGLNTLLYSTESAREKASYGKWFPGHLSFVARGNRVILYQQDGLPDALQFEINLLNYRAPFALID